MLKNAYFLAKIGADTAENERNCAEILPQIGNYPTGPTTGPYGASAVVAEAAAVLQQDEKNAAALESTEGGRR